METILAHRLAVTAADVLAAVVTPTCTKQAGGAQTAGTFTTLIAAGNKYGRTVPTTGDGTVTTETTNLTSRAAWAKVTGADWYDLYSSAAGAAALWVGRITEAQRSAGGSLTAVNTYASAGGIAGAIDIEAIGTGLAANLIVASNAFVIPAALVKTNGRQLVGFDLVMARTGDAVAASLFVVPFFWDNFLKDYFLGEEQEVIFGGASGKYGAWKQRVIVNSGAKRVGLLVAKIAGTGSSLDIKAVIE